MPNIEYSLIRSSRKTIGIYIREDGSVEVRAPIRATQAAIDAFVESKADWIARHSRERAERSEQKKDFSLTFGDTVLYRGRSCMIVPCEGNTASYADGEFRIPADVSDDIAAIIVKLYKILAKNHITSRVLYYAELMGCEVTAVKINSAKGRWGSCSGKNSLNFSWRTVLASDDAIDYVVVHELAHTIEHNHSRRFWNIVEKTLPDYRRREAEFKALSDRLARENWE